MLEAWPDFALACEGPNTEAKPFLLDELGVDFFLRIQLKSRKERLTLTHTALI